MAALRPRLAVPAPVAAPPAQAVDPLLAVTAAVQAGQYAEALVVLRKAVYLAPDDGFAHFLLAGALERLGEPVAAVRSYRAAAGTLGARPLDGVATELGGRSVAELAALCTQQALRLESMSQGGAL